MKNELIAVVGATGKQGRSVVKALLQKGCRVRALARDPDKAKNVLPEERVELCRGDLKKKDSLNALCRDAYGLFFVLPYTKNSIDFGKRVLDVAQESNLEHVIYSSVGGADRYSGVDHYRYKKKTESHLRTIGKPYTILRPVGYMDDFAHPRSIRVVTGLLKLYLPPAKKFQLIALQDIGKFVEIAFSHPDKYQGKEIEIAGDEVTLQEVFEKIENVKHVKTAPMKIPGVMKIVLPKIMKQMFTFYAEDGWQADLESLRKEHPALLSFEDWLRSTDLYEK